MTWIRTSWTDCHSCNAFPVFATLCFHLSSQTEEHRQDGLGSECIAQCGWLAHQSMYRPGIGSQLFSFWKTWTLFWMVYLKWSKLFFSPAVWLVALTPGVVWSSSVHKVCWLCCYVTAEVAGCWWHPLRRWGWEERLLPVRGRGRLKEGMVT